MTHITQEDEAKIIDLFLTENENTTRVISEKLGVSAWHVDRVLNNYLQGKVRKAVVNSYIRYQE
ncbi:hypothetical protein SAMN05444369_101306 [Capnocytophaga haemolytica]|nr:hypothetical protein [Capnocytophaga haemolytica]SFN68117.1 hypothetical protein SAMN05444369_101306 [Capnocytophaga haemolytica]SNV05007.1 Uncharacterised protein [Capnocytophaga haemolytica]